MLLVAIVFYYYLAVLVDTFYMVGNALCVLWLGLRRLYFSRVCAFTWSLYMKLLTYAFMWNGSIVLSIDAADNTLHMYHFLLSLVSDKYTLWYI